ncbi:MAG TPA: UDP-N-acetylmuramoyl-L-alanyl-D-glutamate--2,6-diaminopimelate ligase [Dermatophilaceae bacterium]|nr:UDP-N-acetylmuramoyl-L-alanyl-D-glutamate--2,6-diaminopimelate ligase [Dermatophilaceae bacterium]
MALPSLRPSNPTPVPLPVLARVAGVAGPVDVPGRSRRARGPAEVTGVTLDSRSVQPGDLYAGLPGANVHGARFTAAAVRAGAAAVLTDPSGASTAALSELTVPVLVVPDPRAVLGEVSATVYGRPADRLTVLGVTGTNGKTTTAYLLDSALRALGRRTGLIGTVETRVGDQAVQSVRTTPEAPDLHALFAVMVERGIDTVTMEVSSHALALHRVDGVVCDVAGFTNLSQDHLDFHPTMADYFAAKATLFTPARSRRGVVCVDDEWGRRLAAQAGVPVTTVSATSQADWRLVGQPSGPGFELVGRDATLALRSALPGDFNRVNTAIAALMLLAHGVAAGDVERALAADPRVPGRMERVAIDGVEHAQGVVDFAHTPQAVAAALASLRAGTAGRLVAVLGAGGDRDPDKRAAMGAAAARHADIVVVTDDNPRSEDPGAIRAAVAAGARSVSDRLGQVHVVAGRAEAIRYAVSLAAGPQDTVVVLGKGHETGQEVAGVVHPFDDRDELRAALAAQVVRS